MSFTSLTFLAFLAGLIVLYYVLPRKLQWMLLLAASCAFYLCGGAKTIGYLAFTALTTYAAGRRLGALNARWRALDAQEKKQQKRAHDRRRKGAVWLVCLLNFGVLFALKYWAFLAGALSRRTGLSIFAPELLMPVGVSFYTFQSIGYVVDCYRGKVQPQKNFAKYALFVSFFPQIVQGPIGRYDALAPQLLAEHALDWENIRGGLQLALWGYFKKLLLAERTAALVNTVFASPENYGGAVLVLGVLGYCVQLYCDFSGGIDISRGAAQMLGITMAENFQRPIFARSLTEYWRRWHISLGSWMRDYVFYPLALSRPFRALGSFARKRFRGMLSKIFATSMATFMVYFIIGVWHGANFRYLAFGLYNGVLITAALLLEPLFVRVREKLPIRWDGWAWHGVQMLRTGVIVFIGRYITRAPRLTLALSMLRRSVTDFSLSQLRGGAIFSLGMTRLDWLVVLAGLFVLLAVEVYQERGGKARLLLARQKPAVQGLVTLLWLAALLLLGALGGYTGAGFIYAQY